jgi:hypothetical protein
MTRIHADRGEVIGVAMPYPSGRPQQSAGLGLALTLWAIVVAICAAGVFGKIFLE